MKIDKVRLLMVTLLIIPIAGIATTIAIATTSCSNPPTYEITYESNRDTTISLTGNVVLNVSASINKTNDPSAKWLYCFQNERTSQWYTTEDGLLYLNSTSFAKVNDEIKGIIVYISGNYLGKLKNQVITTHTWKVVE